MIRKHRSLVRILIPFSMLLFASGCIVGIVDSDLNVEDTDEEAWKDINREIPLSTQTSVRVVGANGGIQIHGVPGLGQVTIQARLTVRSHTQADAQDYLHRLRVEVVQGSQELLIRTDQPQNTHGRSVSIDYEISVPDDLMVEVVNGNGPVSVENIRAWTSVETGNGGVVLSNIEGSVATTVGNGGFEGSVHLPLGGSAVVIVGNGGLELNLQESVSAELTARIGNGPITVAGLPFTEQATSPGLVTGTLGNGDGLVDLTVGNGWLQVRGR